MAADREDVLEKLSLVKSKLNGISDGVDSKNDIENIRLAVTWESLDIIDNILDSLACHF